MSYPAVFFDRDNTLNYDSGYISDPKKIELIEGVGEGIKTLKKDFGFKIVVISNQSGIARGYFSEDDVKLVNSKINEILLSKFNVSIDAFYFCPHHPEFSTEEETKCRKPSPMMVLKAAEELNLDLKKSYFVGDSTSDILCGINAGVKTVLFDYKNDEEKIILLKKINKSPNFRVNNFLNAVNWITADFVEGDTFDK